MKKKGYLKIRATISLLKFCLISPSFYFNQQLKHSGREPLFAVLAIESCCYHHHCCMASMNKQWRLNSCNFYSSFLSNDPTISTKQKLQASPERSAKPNITFDYSHKNNRLHNRCGYLETNEIMSFSCLCINQTMVQLMKPAKNRTRYQRKGGPCCSGFIDLVAP